MQSGGEPETSGSLESIPGSRERVVGLTASLLTFYAISVILWPLVFLGIDLVDSGLFLYDQEQTVQNGTVVNRLWWLSDYLGGWWLHLSSPYGLVGARIGGLLCVALSGALAVAAAARILGYSHWLFAFAAIAVAPIAKPLILMAHYYSIPMVLALAFALAYASLVRNVEAARSSTTSAITGGVLLAALILAKVTGVIAIALPVGATALVMLFDRSQLRETIRANAVLLTSAAGCMLLLAGYVAMAHGLDAFSALPVDPYPRAEYSLWSVVETTFGQLRPHGFILGILFGGVLVTGIWPRRRAPAIIWFVAWLAIGCAASLAKTPGVGSLHVPHWLQLSGGHKAWTLSNFLLLVFAPLGLGGLVLLLREAAIGRRRDSYRLAVMALFALMLPVVIGLGSNQGIAKFRLGLAPLALFVVALALREERPAARRAWSVALVCAFAVIGLASLTHAYTQFYGDYKKVREFTYSFEKGRLKGVRTRKGRGRSINAVVEQIKRRTHPGATILAYGNCPMLYYASERSPYRGLVWPRVYSEQYLDGKLTDPSPDEAPALLIRFKRRLEKNAHITQRMREAFRPRVVWQNKMFEILEPTIHPGAH